MTPKTLLSVFRHNPDKCAEFYRYWSNWRSTFKKLFPSHFKLHNICNWNDI